MIRQYELVERVQSYNPHADEALLNKAYVYAMRAHGHQTRASGDPYFSHPLEVAAILTNLKLDDATIAVGLLHDTIEDTETTRAEIDALFGHEIGKLVDGLTKVNKLDFASKQAEQAGNLRKLLLAVSDDVRVLLVKLADRLHNMRTLSHVRKDKRERIAQETMDIYAPLAGRMGMQDIREELEDLSFQALQPDHYGAITERLNQLNSQNRDLASEIQQALQTVLAKSDIKATVFGRLKRPYSIFAKMNRTSLGFEQLSDIFAFRVIVEALEDCYRALGAIHLRWAMVPMRFKDYISLPKQNDYRSLHTTVIGPSSQRVELQIRTWDMHRIAEYGVAAHVLYKDYEAPDLTQLEPDVRAYMEENRLADGTNGASPRKRFKALHKDSRAYAWLRNTIALLAHGDSPEEFLEHTKLELFRDQVFCFTPQGRLISLPNGATPIDFAYAVHTEIGNTCTGTKINGQVKPLLSTLENGDEVEIITDPKHTPPPVWAKIAVTGKARAAIRRATRQAVVSHAQELGKEMLEAAFRRSRRSYSSARLSRALPQLKRESVPDLLVAVGMGEVDVETVMGAIFPTRARRSKQDTVEDATAPQALRDRHGAAVPIRGIGQDMPIRFSDAGAVPGDRIVGILTPGEGVQIFPIQASALRNFEDEPERWLDVRWDERAPLHGLYPARIVIAARNQPGVLSKITQVISDNGADIANIQISGPLPDFKELTIDLLVTDMQCLSRIMGGLNKISNVSSVERLFG